MKDYSFIIDEICTPKKSNELVRQMIPILIAWAQEQKSPQYYSTLSKAIGHSTHRIGYQLGLLGDVFKKLSELSHKDIPILNALVINKGSKRPGDGLRVVMKEYDTKDLYKKEYIAEYANKKAYNYKDWPWVLESLGLMPVKVDEETDIRKGKYRGSSEGVYHKKLKKYVLNHPFEFGINNVKESENEHILLSGDKLDVYFLLKDGKQVAVEVKSRISDDADLLRGIYQCVKYKAVLSAECQAHARKPDIDAFLVVERELPIELQKTANMLSVKYVVIKVA